MYVCKRDEIQLYVVVFLKFLLDYFCALIYTRVSGACTPLSLAALTNIQHRRCTNPEFMSEGEQSRRVEARSAEQFPIKTGRHMVNHSAPQTCSALIKCASLSFFNDYDTALAFLSLSFSPSLVFLWSMVCHHVSRSWEMSCIKTTNTKHRKKYSPGV